MTTAIMILSTLADPIRLQAMRLLQDGKERCVCEMMEALGATQSRASRHMSALKAAGLIVVRRDAQWVRYRLNPHMSKAAKELVKAALRLEVLPQEERPTRKRR